MIDLQEALRRALEGDSEGLAALYGALADPLLSYIRTQVRRREDAEDLLGQVFLEALRDLGRFSGDVGGFRAWLFRIAYHRSVDLARRQSRRAEEPLDSVHQRPAADDPESEVLDRLDRLRLRAAVDRLPPEQRRVISLRLAGALSAAEIGKILGKSTGAVKALQFRALANLSRAFRDHERQGHREPEAGGAVSAPVSPALINAESDGLEDA